MDRLKNNDSEKLPGDFAEPGSSNGGKSDFVSPSENQPEIPDSPELSAKKEEINEELKKSKEEREEKDKADADQLIVINGAKIKFNAHLGEFKVLNDVPTTQDKLTGTIVEKQIPNFTFYDGFQMISLTDWLDFGTVKVQENEVLIKKSKLPSVGKMPGNIPPETGNIEFIDSGQVHVPENINTEGAPIPKTDEEKECFCVKDFTEEDIKSFYNSKKLFSAKNCPLPNEIKTYTAFTDALNKAMKDNNIDTCLKKAHFLAQIETESDRLNTTMEYASGWDYDSSTHLDGYNKYKLYLDNIKKKKDNPYLVNNTKELKRSYNRYKECLSHGHNSKGDGPKYKGKGLIQLTWKDTYEKYFNHLGKPKLIETPEVVANDLSFTCDSAGWFWDDRQLGGYADKDDLIFISVRINGGLNGFEHRKSNVKSIIKLMKISENCTTNKLKTIGTYKYDTSNIKNLKWGKKNKSKIEKFDD